MRFNWSACQLIAKLIQNVHDSKNKRRWSAMRNVTWCTLHTTYRLHGWSLQFVSPLIFFFLFFFTTFDRVYEQKSSQHRFSMRNSILSTSETVNDYSPMYSAIWKSSNLNYFILLLLLHISPVLWFCFHFTIFLFLQCLMRPCANGGERRDGRNDKTWTTKVFSVQYNAMR